MTKENQITTTNNNGSFLTDKGAFEHTWRVATAFSKSQLVPTHFQNKPEDCMVALMMANQLKHQKRVIIRLCLFGREISLPTI